MTHDYKAALNAFNKIINRLDYYKDILNLAGMEDDGRDSIRSALLLAQEAEQLRKERDEWQIKYNALLRVFGTVSDELESKENKNENA